MASSTKETTREQIEIDQQSNNSDSSGSAKKEEEEEDMPAFKDEHIIIIAPGSQTTLAQLGLPESFSPPTHRFPSRMFLSPDGKTFEPYKIQARKKAANGDGDVDMDGAEANGDDEDEELLEYPDDDEGAIYPLKGTCFYRADNPIESC